MLLSHLMEAYGIGSDAGGARVAGRVEIAPLPSGEPVVLGVNTAIPTGLILNELISNALKHAFAGGRSGTLTVCGELRDGLIGAGMRRATCWTPTERCIRQGTLRTANP